MIGRSYWLADKSETTWGRSVNVLGNGMKCVAWRLVEKDEGYNWKTKGRGTEEGDDHLKQLAVIYLE